MDLVLRLAAIAVGLILAVAGSAKLASPTKPPLEGVPAAWVPLLSASHSRAFASFELFIALLLPMADRPVALILCHGGIALLAMIGLLSQFALAGYDCKCFGVLTPKRKGSIQLAHAVLFFLAISVALRAGLSPPTPLVEWQLAGMFATAATAIWASVTVARRSIAERMVAPVRTVQAHRSPDPLPPAFELGLDRDGDTVTLGSLAKPNSPVFIVGVHSACKACKTLLPDIESFARGFADQFPIVVIADKDEMGYAQSSLANLLVDEKERLATQFHIDGRPFALVINGGTMAPIAPPSLGDNAVRMLFAVMLNARLPVPA
jgi:hypothetical protein